LHQAADSALWPEGIIYDPDDDGIIISSLGVHEHWNDSLNKQYTRNLGTGDGIELIKVHEVSTGINSETALLSVSVYPNPFNEFVSISNAENESVNYSIINVNGVVLASGNIERQSVKKVNLTKLTKGVYFIAFNSKQSIKLIKN